MQPKNVCAFLQGHAASLTNAHASLRENVKIANVHASLEGMETRVAPKDAWKGTTSVLTNRHAKRRQPAQSGVWRRTTLVSRQMLIAQGVLSVAKSVNLAVLVTSCLMTRAPQSHLWVARLAVAPLRMGSAHPLRVVEPAAVAPKRDLSVAKTFLVADAS